jgi:hypothetical protein
MAKEILLENIFNTAYIIEEAVNDKEKKGSKSSSQHNNDNNNYNNNDKYGTLKRLGALSLGMLIGHGMRDIYNKLNEDDEYTKVAKIVNYHHDDEE